MFSISVVIDVYVCFLLFGLLYVMLQSNNDVDIVPKTSVAGTVLF